MRQRLISAAVAIALGIVILFFYRTIVLNIVVALIIFMALYEVLIATKIIENRFLFAICAAFGVFVPFFRLQPLKHVAYMMCYLFVVILFLFLMTHHSKMKFDQIAKVFLLTLQIAFSFSCIAFLKEIYRTDPVGKGLFYILFILIGAWMADAGGYFIGRFFGKHKLAPVISPKKTVEGVAGGFVFTLVSLFALSLSFVAVAAHSGYTVHINYLPLTVVSLLTSALAVIGDLSMSVIKRETHLKDFGNVLPGHGGVLDRFDSVMFVAPMVFLFLQAFPIIG